MKVIILEDERLTAQRLIKLLEEIDPSIEVITHLGSVSEAKEWFAENKESTLGKSLDLIFMDIHLGDGDCFEVIRACGLSYPIIFTTAFDEYLIQAFKVNSVDYLLKPINLEELDAAIKKYHAVKSLYATTSNENTSLQNLIEQLTAPQTEAYKDRFMVSLGTKIQSIPTQNIAYFYLEERIVFLVTKDKKTFPMDYSLDKLTKVLNPKDFFRINRQFIISLECIQVIHNQSAGRLKLEILPKPSQEIIVSMDRISEFKGWLGKD